MTAAAAPPPRPRRVDDRGSTSLEFLITATAVIGVFFTGLQATTYYWARSIALAAAQEAVDTQRTYDAPPGAGHHRATAFIASTGDGLSATTISVTSDGQNITATITGRCLSVLPGFCEHTTVHATVHGTVERTTSP